MKNIIRKMLKTKAVIGLLALFILLIAILFSMSFRTRHLSGRMFLIRTIVNKEMFANWLADEIASELTLLHNLPAGYPVIGHTILTPDPKETNLFNRDCTASQPTNNLGEPCVLLNSNHTYIYLKLSNGPSEVDLYRVYLLSPWPGSQLDIGRAPSVSVDFSFNLTTGKYQSMAQNAVLKALENLGVDEYHFMPSP